MISKELLEILACPKCKGDLELKENELICSACKLAYPIKEDIPVMMVEEARRIEQEKP